MALSTAAEITRSARKAGVGCAAFNVVTLEQITAVVDGARHTGVPVIVQVSQNAVRYHGALAPIGAAALAAAEHARVPVAVHLDHAESIELVREAVRIGFGSVMYDGSTLDYEDNVRRTADVVAECHAAGVAVEAELGEIGGKGAHAPGVRTDPGQAREFVLQTGVDALAVAVGSSHAMVSRNAALDFELIERLNAVLDVPLVLHGSSGVPDDDLTKAVRSGMTKINIATQLNKVFTATVRAHLTENPDVVDAREYLASGRAALADEVTRLMRVFATPEKPE